MASGESVDASAADLLLQVESRLRQKILDFNEGNCFITDEPVPPSSYFPQGKIACTICLLDGKFDRGLWVGGGPNQLNETSDLVVTLLTRSKIDQPPRAKVAILGEDRGILTVFKPQLLQALLVDDPIAEVLVPWIPLTPAKEEFLRDGGLTPTHCRGPTQLTGGDWIGLELHFAVSFDWDLRESAIPSG